MVKDHLEAGRLRAGERDPEGTPARIGKSTKDQPHVAAWIVVTHQIAPLPKHQQNPGTQREREARAKAHAKHLDPKGRTSKPPSDLAKKDAQTWILFTTATSVDRAVGEDAARMSIEQTFRDWHHGWGLREVASTLREESAVSRLVGIVCLADHFQVTIGVRFRQDPHGQERRLQWTVTDRVSYFWCAHHLFTDPGKDGSPWLAHQWDYFLPHQTTMTLAEAA